MSFIEEGDGQVKDGDCDNYHRQIGKKILGIEEIIFQN